MKPILFPIITFSTSCGANMPELLGYAYITHIVTEKNELYNRGKA
jgi:hypothetical protein